MSAMSGWRRAHRRSAQAGMAHARNPLASRRRTADFCDMNEPRIAVVDVRHVRCGYGGTGLAPPSYCTVKPYFDVTATGAITGLRMTAFVVTDIAQASGPIELRIWLPGRDADHNELTKPFD